MRTTRLASLVLAFTAVAGILVAFEGQRVKAAGGSDPTCSRPSPCILYNNTGKGPGVEGKSSLGTGSVGITTNNSTSASNGTSGILGNDLSTSGTFNSGVSGVSVRGIGVTGSSTSGNGIVASSVSGAGLIATSTSSDAIYATSTKFYGIGGLTLNPSKTTGTGYSGVLAQDNSSDGGHLNSGVLGYSVNGFGVAAFSSSWVGANVTGGFTTSTDVVPALSIVGNNSGGSPNDLIDACGVGSVSPCDNLHSIFGVDGLGDVLAHAKVEVGGLIIGFGGIETLGDGNDIQSGSNFDINGSGYYLKDGNCVAGCSMAKSGLGGRGVTTYASMTSQPVVEDFGEAQLVQGQTFVPLDSKFANVIEQQRNYLVFITPEGDANVLYVTQKSPQGFEVRESHGGRSSITFSYRIVATPYGSHAPRLPWVQIPKLQHRPASLKSSSQRFPVR